MTVQAAPVNPPPVIAGAPPPLIVSNPAAFWRLVDELETRYGLKETPNHETEYKIR